MLAILMSKTGLIGMAIALFLGAFFIQTARLNHAKSDLTVARAQIEMDAKSLKASEDLRQAEYAKATSAVSDAETACAGRVAAALKSGSAIHAIVSKPYVPDPKSGCPVRSIVGADELRGALQPSS
jgi:hypothetical protein